MKYKCNHCGAMANAKTFEDIVSLNKECKRCFGADNSVRKMRKQHKQKQHKKMIIPNPNDLNSLFN